MQPRYASRRVRSLCLVACVAATATACESAADRTDQAPSQSALGTAGDSLLSRAITYHDPNGVWDNSDFRIEWFGTGADGSERTSVRLHLRREEGIFELSGQYRGSELEYRTQGSQWTATVDGNTDLEPEVMDRMRLSREEGMFWRDYFSFLAGLPMKLRDPGTIIDPTPTSTTFEGNDVLALRVSYDPDVGGDTWYFYFDPDSASLVGCRFYHDESANDGEYIVLEGLIESGGVRIPRNRRWYVNDDGRFLGADDIRSLELISGR